MKRTPLRRGAGLKRGTPLARGNEIPRAKRLSPRSKKREEEAAERTIVRTHVFARDRWECQMARVLRDHGEHVMAAGPCIGALTVHHLRKASAGGAYTAGNLLSLCAGHNSWVEDHPLHATELGLVIR